MIPNPIKRLSLVMAGTLVLSVCGDLGAGDGDDTRITPRSVPKFKGTEVAKRVDRMLSGVNWHGNFDDAMATAVEQGKPLFWLQMVGKIDGGL
jgi:hypothetical protein